MFRIPLGVALPAAATTLLLAATGAVAQPAAVAAAASAPRRADPADPGASVPALSYRSAFAGYRPNVEQPVGAWRELSDSVGRVGGWRSYAREAQSTAPPAAAASAPATADKR